ncbi:MAG: type II toxin-antitoxin system mRNA interferase toxin, RelE/StbE family, partial [Planctomycetes bacterium]|nr:type II toxin-antitoxin system mRNA interferase toxin, RelE/StbE family [Planctomycetota bacterium]
MNILYAGQFKKDYKRSVKQGKDAKKLQSVITKLCKQEKLGTRHRDHKLG